MGVNTNNDRVLKMEQGLDSVEEKGWSVKGKKVRAWKWSTVRVRKREKGYSGRMSGIRFRVGLEKKSSSRAKKPA